VKDVNDLARMMHEAFYVARTGRPGPVVVDCPKDVQNAALRFHGEGELALPGYRARLRRVEQAALSDAECAAFFEALLRARGVLRVIDTAGLRGLEVSRCSTSRPRDRETPRPLFHSYRRDRQGGRNLAVAAQ